MKSLVEIRKSASSLSRAASSSAVYLTATLMVGLAFADHITAAMVPDATPKDWPANPTKHQVVIRREAADEKQSAMIAAAEAAQAPKQAVLKAAADDAAPAGDKTWWYKEQLGIRIPYAITADAVAYYAELIGKYGKQTFNRYVEPSSSLNYQASVKFHKEFKLDDKTFNDVHVVTLKLIFGQQFAATQTEGMHFQKERVVVLDAAGKVLHISGDGLTEVPVVAI